MFGSMSVASIERDTSIATTMVARSRGTFTESLGWANATTSDARLMTAAKTAMCRFLDACLGSTRSRLSMPYLRLRVELRRSSAK